MIGMMTIEQASEALVAVERLAEAYGVTVDASVVTLLRRRVLRLEFTRGPWTVGLLRIDEDVIGACVDAAALCALLERAVSVELQPLMGALRA